MSAGIIRELCSAFPHRKCWGTHWTFAVVNYYSSMPILNFQTLFFKTSGFSIFLSDSNETSYGNWKHNEIVIYEILFGYPALTDSYGWSKVVPFFMDHLI